MRSTFESLGLRNIKSLSGPSYAIAIAGTISVPILIYIISSALNGDGIDIKMLRSTGINSGMLVAISYVMTFFKLSNKSLPSIIPCTIEAKLSSSKIISDASLATSVPSIPIAIPISAFFMAGESLTPSPVTATMYPAC